MKTVAGSILMLAGSVLAAGVLVAAPGGNIHPHEHPLHLCLELTAFIELLGGLALMLADVRRGGKT